MQTLAGGHGAIGSAVTEAGVDLGGAWCSGPGHSPALSALESSRMPPPSGSLRPRTLLSPQFEALEHCH